MGNAVAPKMKEDIGELDKSSHTEFGLVNIDSHSYNNIHWTNWLEIVMITVMFLAIVRLVMKYIKKRNEKRMRAMGSAVASLMTSNAAPNTQTVHMTSLPMIRTARGPTIRTMETSRDNTMAITGPAVNESTGPNFEAWTNCQ